MHGTCNTCGSAYSDCPCETQAREIVLDIVCREATGEALRRYCQLYPRFDSTQWGRWFAEAFASRAPRGHRLPRPLQTKQR
jgi:hypothetical protein